MSRVTLALAVAASIAAIGPSLAADMYGAPPPAPGYGYAAPVASAPAWNGPYLGGQVGHGWGPNSLDGLQVGVYGGINSTVGKNVVVGAEADLNISGQTADRVVSGNLYKYRSDWNGSIRGRVGVAFDKVMPYATGGVAFADNTLKALGRSSSTTSVGYALGGGVEGQVVDRVTLKGELIHEGFGRENHGIGGASSSVNSNILRGGAAFHF
ncbi:porin family protein [Siculibacillus lacustris]|uniref:Porin family protein n=1 Tax=Siculibacillus lacustris TaxID=1549641 RepID=A0A4Q9VIW2_9HYPH|nr:outer membrane beta-barrel protein [Siculibacillus lacustris]TBW34719.1 porin family protein [Siculibacillus lacustris]